MQKYETKGGKAYMFYLRCVFTPYSTRNEEFAHEIDLHFVQNDSIISKKNLRHAPCGNLEGRAGYRAPCHIPYMLCVLSLYFIGVSTIMTTVLL